MTKLTTCASPIDLLKKMHLNERVMNTMHATKSHDKSVSHLVADIVRSIPISASLAVKEDNIGVITIDGYSISFEEGVLSTLDKCKKEEGVTVGHIDAELVDAWPDYLSRALCSVHVATYRPLRLSESGTVYHPVNGWKVAVMGSKVLLSLRAHNSSGRTIELIISPAVAPTVEVQMSTVPFIV